MTRQLPARQLQNVMRSMQILSRLDKDNVFDIAYDHCAKIDSLTVWKIHG